MAIDGIGSKITTYTNISNKPVPTKDVKSAEPKDVYKVPEKPVEKTPEKTAEKALNTDSASSNNGFDEAADKQNVVAAKKPAKNAVAEMNKKMIHSRRCEFSYHEETKRVSIKVIDQETDEVIREIPPEETLDMLTKMWEAAGILVDEQR